MGSKKNTELNFLYLDDKYAKDKKEKKEKKPVTKKTTKKKTKSKQEQKETVFDFDNEIVIGVTKSEPQTTKKANTEKKKSSQKKQVKKKATAVSEKEINVKEKKKGADRKSAPTKKKVSSKKSKKVTKKTIIVRGIIKWTILLGALVASFIFFMMSPLFNLSEITVVGNEKIATDSIISLSQLQIGENIYKTSSRKIENKIKQNPYIESIQIKRNLPSKITITAKERKTTYMLEYANSYAYINNQGYILEISEQKLEVPIIIGYSISQEQIKPGNRLQEEDLLKLETVLKIMDSANANNIGNLITRFDISNKQEYKVSMETEKKTIYFGDATNLSTRMLYLKAALEDAKGLEGEIFVSGDLNKEKAFFREKQ